MADRERISKCESARKDGNVTRSGHRPLPNCIKETPRNPVLGAYLSRESTVVSSTAIAALHLLRFAFDGPLQCAVERGFGFVVLLLGDLARLVLDLELEEFLF